jgi:tetratricopeptide (TPR) repeat protein
MPQEQKLELLLLYLHLAGTYRELHQLEDAYEHYRVTLQLVNLETPLGCVAEAHWGMALIALAQANSIYNDTRTKDKNLLIALDQARNALFLYRAIREQLSVSTVICQIAQIEQMLGHVEQAQNHLQEVLASWSHILQEAPATTQAGKGNQKEKANVVSIAACALASIELDAHNYTAARQYADCALEAGKRSYKLRRADAYLMLGRILESTDLRNPDAENAFRCATSELADTDRIGARINAHMLLGRHLLKIDKTEEGERELEQARLLSYMASPCSCNGCTEDAQFA